MRYGQRWQKTFLQCLQRVSQGQAASYPDEFEANVQSNDKPETR